MSESQLLGLDICQTTTKSAISRWDLDTLRPLLTQSLGNIVTECDALRIEYLCEPKAVADDATKLLVLDENNKRIAVILVSSQIEPKLIGRSINQARDIKKHLNPSLGSVILEAMASGTVNACTYAVLPYCNPVSNRRLLKRVHRIMIRSTVLEWLAQVIETTARIPDKDTIFSGFVAPLQHLVATEIMQAPIRNMACEAIGHIQTGAWLPRHVVMHGDFWEGNILFSNKEARDAKNPFASIVIIDWPGGLIDGYAMYDIVRLGMFMKLPKRIIHSQVQRHCLALGCDMQDARFHLLTALGHLGMNLGFFPPNRYASMVANCVRYLDEVIGS